MEVMVMTKPRTAQFTQKTVLHGPVHDQAEQTFQSAISELGTNNTNQFLWPIWVELL